MIEILIISAQIYLLLLITGAGIATFLLPKKFQTDLVWFAPWIGTIIIAIVGVYISMAGIPMRVGSYIVLGFFSFLFLHALKHNKIRITFSQEFIVIGFLTASIFFMNIYPLLIRVGFPTTISLGNLDPLAYVHSGEYLIDHTVFDTFTSDPLKPSISGASDIVSYSYRWGAALLFSFFGVLLRMQAYQLYSILITIYFALTYPLIYIFSKQLVKRGSIYWLVIALTTFATYGINATLLYMLYNVFFGQIIFAGVFTLFIILYLEYVRNKKLTYSPSTFELLIAGTISSITTLYPDGFILVYLPIIGCAVLSRLLQKNFIQARNAFKITIYAILFNPVTAFTTGKWIVRMIKVTTAEEVIGWEPIRYSLPFEFMGFHNLYYSRDLPIFIDIIAGLVLGSIMLLGLYKAKEKLLLVLYISLFLAFNVFFRFISPNFFVYHRTITYAIFIYSALFAVGMAALLSRLNKKSITLLVTLGILFFSLRSAQRTIFQMYHHMRTVNVPLISLQSLNHNVSITGPIITSDVYSPNYDVWTRLWREYFLQNKQLITLSNYGSVKKYITNATPVLLENDISAPYSPALLLTDIIWENEYYRLGRICQKTECLIETKEDLSVVDFVTSKTQDSLVGEGWHVREGGHRWIASSEAVLRLVTKGPSTKLILNASTPKQPQVMKVLVNNVPVGKLMLSTDPQEYILRTKGTTKIGVNEIRFLFSYGYSPVQVLGTTDDRTLYANFLKIALQ